MIDLRTDTVTRPTEAMLDSMRDATLGDDSRDGDATVGRLESLAAALTGKEAGAYMPSGTMTNLVAVLTHTPRGGEVLLDAGAHILNSELGGVTALAGAFYRGMPGKHGAMDVEALGEAIRPPTRNNFGTALVCMETTHNRAGGAVLPLAHMKAVYDLARATASRSILDGARIFNAAVALGVPANEIAQPYRHRRLLRFQGPLGAGRVGPLRHGRIHRARARLPPHGRRQHAPGRSHWRQPASSPWRR